MTRRQIDAQELASIIATMLVRETDSEDEREREREDLSDQFLADVTIDRIDARTLRITIADGAYSYGGTWDVEVRSAGAFAPGKGTMNVNRQAIDAQLSNMREGIERAVSDLDAKLTELDQLMVTNAALAQDAHDMAADAADIARRLTGSLSLLAGKYTELKAEFPNPFRVPGNRPDVIAALRNAGIAIQVYS